MSLDEMKSSITAIIQQMSKISELAQIQATLTEELNSSSDVISTMTLDMLEMAKTS